MTIPQVATPPLPAAAPRTPARSGPTPPDKRVLDQREFDRKLRAKQVHYITIQYCTILYCTARQAGILLRGPQHVAGLLQTARQTQKEDLGAVTAQNQGTCYLMLCNLNFR